MFNNIYIVTWPNGYFGSSGQSWKSLDVKKISTHLTHLAENILFRDIITIRKEKLTKNDIVIYCSSDEKNMREYIKDCMYFIDNKAVLVPSYAALLAHENKGFQQLYRNEHSFGNLDGDYGFDLDLMYKKDPFVLKTVSGAGSSGVFLIKDYKSFIKIRRKLTGLSILRKLVKLFRRLMLTKKEYELYHYRHKGHAQTVTQNFIQGLTHDYKVLIFSDKYYVLKRNVRKNDFRASGSGNFEFEKAPLEVLDFAHEIYSTLNEPYASLDIAITDEKAFLIEFQILNFGPLTLTKSKGFYRKNNIEWEYTEAISDIEDCFGEALSEYIGKKNANQDD